VTLIQHLLRQTTRSRLTLQGANSGSNTSFDLLSYVQMYSAVATSLQAAERVSTVGAHSTYLCPLEV
jgi:hypothetical protein